MLLGKLVVCCDNENKYHFEFVCCKLFPCRLDGIIYLAVSIKAISDYGPFFSVERIKCY